MKTAKTAGLGLLTETENAHAASILDPEPTIEPIPPERKVRILVGSVVRKPPEVLDAWLKTLEWQQLRTPTQIDYVFLHNFSATDSFREGSLALLDAFSANGTTHFAQVQAPAAEDYGQNATTRQWTPEAWHRVGAAKDTIIQRALDENYDYLWLVDADVLCDPFTLQSLLDSADVEHHRIDPSAYRGPIVSGVYWTQWSKQSEEDAEHQHCGPQVWLRHPYEVSGRGWTAQSFREALVQRQRIRVWGLGACTLIPAHALRKGASFSRMGDLPPGPMSDGEDRHFCHRADNLHLELVADAWPDIYHAYHPSEYDRIPEMLERLERVQYALPGGPNSDVNVFHLGTGYAKPGDLVSLRISNLELNVALETQYIRGRLGVLNLLPELEEALHELPIGESKLVKAHYPVHAKNPQLRNQSFVMRVTLFDAKPFGLAPTIDEEVLLGGKSKKVIDCMAYDQKQVDEMVDGASVV